MVLQRPLFFEKQLFSLFGKKKGETSSLCDK